MSKTLAELRAERTERPAARRPMVTMTVCLAPDLLAEITKATAEYDRCQSEVRSLAPSDAEDADAAPKRVSGDDPAIKKARAKAAADLAQAKAHLEDLLAEMSTYEGELALRANLTDGEWRRWANDHPARDEGEPGYDRDQRVTLGYCSADALIEHLGAFVHLWNSEPIGTEDWAEVLEPDVGTADKAEMALGIIGLYESRVNFTRLRTNLSANLKRLSDSSSPANSASPTSDSTDGPPTKSTEATTSTATA